MRIDYAQILDDSRSFEVRLSSGESVSVRRQTLKGFFKLKALEKDIVDAIEKKDASRLETCLRNYIQTGAGVSTYSGLDVFRFMLFINLANRLGGTLAIIENIKDGKEQEESFEYPNRVYALWVHQLASHYHWSREEILGLYPAEALCYLQEIMHDEWKEREWEWEMAGFGVSYDKNGKASRNVFPTPAWADKKTVITKTKLAKAFLPQGAVIDLGGSGVFTEKNTIIESGIGGNGDNAATGGTVDDTSVPAHQ